MPRPGQRPAAIRGCHPPQPFRQIVIVDPDCNRYPDFVAEAAAGRLGLHFCTDARAALRLARRLRADAWVVRTDLSDMDGLDLLPLLSEQLSQSKVDPLLRATAGLSEDGSRAGRGGIFIAAETYRSGEEERSLAGGSAGYLVQPVTIDLLASIVPLEAGTAS